MPPRVLPTNRRTSVLAVVSESLPTRTSDLRFTALDECDRLARASREIVLREDFDFEIIEQRERVTRISVAYHTVAYPVVTEGMHDEWDPALVKRLRDLGIQSGGFVIAEI